MKAKKEKNIGGAFKPTNGAKPISGAGSYSDTFAGKLEYFNPQMKDKGKAEKEPKNFILNPPKKGGPGYPSVCIGKDPEYKPSAYDEVDKLRKEENAKHKEKLRGPLKLGTKTAEFFEPNPYTDPKGRCRCRRLILPPLVTSHTLPSISLFL
jgi:hypothetical protein